MKRKIISLVLALTILLSAAPAAFAAEGSFTDISDKNVAQAVETLRMLGVVDGMSDGKFVPNGTLTRAQFCKMAIVMLGIEGQEPSYRNRTIFSDVTSGHWARGYINLAATGSSAFISGMGNGLFAPDENITFAQAVTILVRLLGYSDTDTSMQWPEGYITLADSIGLTAEVSLGADAAITRGQAAQLFCAMLLSDTKTGSAYIARFGTVSEGVIMLDNAAVAADGSSGAVYTSAGTFKTDVAVADSCIGQRGTLVTGSGKLVAFIPTDSSSITVSAAVIESGWFKTSTGTRYSIASSTKVYTSSAAKTWGDVWLDMPTGSNLTVYFDAKGSIEAVFYATSAATDNVAVAMNEVKGNPFTSLLKIEGSCDVYKNGALASVADIRRYDVAEYDKAAAQLRVNDFKLTGCYENAYPSTASPEKIKLLGHTWEVLPSAQESLANFDIGDMVTLLFTADMRVAGAVSTGEASGNAVGVVKSSSGGKVTVELLSTTRSGSLTLSGSSAGSSSSLVGELVIVSGSADGRLYIRPIGEGVKAANINVEAMTYGSMQISSAVKVFDRVGNTVPVSVSLSELPQQISASSVLYARQDYAGRIDMLVLNDVSGECYTYGLVSISSTKETGENGDTYKYSATITGKSGSVSFSQYPLNLLRHNSCAGIVASVDGTRIISAVSLTKIRNVSRSDFKTGDGEVTLVVDGVSYPVADNVQCYNSAAGEWFDSLNDARKFSSVLSVYYDRDPANGGKIRMVIVE